MSRRRANSPIGTGPAFPERANSASARTAYGDFEVIVNKAGSSLGYAYDAGLPTADVATAARPDGPDLLPVGAAEPVVRARQLGPPSAQVRAHDRVRGPD